MNVANVKMPARYQLLDSMPEDPPFLKVYGYQTDGALCSVKCMPFRAENAMPYENPRAVIDGIHEALGEDQGLIEVESDVTAAGRRFLYSVVKTLQKPDGVQYCLTMHLDYMNYAFQIQGFFDETGRTGVRDTMVYLLLSKEGAVRITEDGIEGWCADPYDPVYKRGCLMNCSERKSFDKEFPQHPLTELRRFVKELADLN